jgi:hypothetical protein
MKNPNNVIAWTICKRAFAHPQMAYTLVDTRQGKRLEIELPAKIGGHS